MKDEGCGAGCGFLALRILVIGALGSSIAILIVLIQRPGGSLVLDLIMGLAAAACAYWLDKVVGWVRGAK